MMKKISQLDKHISTKIIKADYLIASLVLYPLAAFFHPKLIWIAYVSVWFASGKDWKSTGIYVVGTGLCLLTTYLLKRLFKRARPALQNSLLKSGYFRKKEKNNSMPSGDAIQSAFFVTYLYLLGIQLPYLLVFHLGVCLGRVYYMCHWIGDTLVSTVLGTLLAFYLSGTSFYGLL